MPVDGEYGPITRRAVRRFQASHGLVVDGIVGPQTLAALRIRRSSGTSSGGSGGSIPRIVTRRDRRAAARSALGRPYAWGGNGPGSFDCSGLMVWAWRQAGVTLPGQSYAQYLAGRPVSRSNVRAGDLVFFATNGPGASHVGIAISGSSFISATTRGVRVQLDRRLVLGLELRRRAPRGLGDRYRAGRARDAPNAALASDDVREPPRCPAVEPEAGADPAFRGRRWGRASPALRGARPDPCPRVPRLESGQAHGR